MSQAGLVHTLKINKDCYVVNAFHPSVFAKGLDAGRLQDREAVLKAALLEFCFLRAVNIAMGVAIVGAGIEKLRNLALGTTR